MSNGPRFPKTELEKDLTPVHFKDGKYETIYRSFKLPEFIAYLQEKIKHKDPQSEQEVTENREQWVTTRMKRSRKGNWYEEIVVFNANEIKSEEHMPDRFGKKEKEEIQDDIPF